MFKNALAQTPLTTNAANAYFSHIVGGDYNGDTTLAATLRALIAPRMAEDDYLYVSFSQSRTSASTVDNATNKSYLLNQMFSSAYLNDASYLTIHDLCSGNETDNDASLEFIKENFTKSYPEWHSLDDMENLFRKSFGCLCFINPELKSTLIVVSSLNMRKYHYLQCAILGTMPWYFDPSKGITELENEIIYSLREKESARYEAAIAKYAERFDFATARIRSLLDGFETRYERRQIDSLKHEIERNINKINNLNSQIGSLFSENNHYNVQLMGLMCKTTETGNDSEIMEYFLCNRRLYLEDVTETSMYFCVKDYITYFDEELVKKCLDNPRSFVYSEAGRSSIENDDMKKLMTAVFLDGTIKIKVCAAYSFDLDGTVRAQSLHTFGPDFRDYMPNPHINRYSCMGNYHQAINTLLMNNDYIGALEQCIASAKSLNWGDGCVMSEFFKTLYGRSDYGFNNKCFELPDGRVVTPKDAIAWLNTTSNEETENE